MANETNASSIGEDDAVQDFALTLIQHAKGRAHIDASRALTDLIAAVRDLGGSGTVTVKLKVSRDKNDDMVKLEDTVTTTAPRQVRRSLWFTGDDGTLHRNDPRQLEFPTAADADK